MKRSKNCNRGVEWGLVLALAGCLATACAAQGDRAALSVEATVHAGGIIRHTKKLTTQTAGWRGGQEIAVFWQTLGRRDWQVQQRFPGMGLSLVHFEFGSGSHERGFGLLPFLVVPLERSGRFGMFFRVGTGVAWVARPYEAFSNPGQNAIGSHLNNITQFRLGAGYRLGQRVHLSAGAALTHFSNGAFALPNLGINLPSMYAGLRWSARPIPESLFSQKPVLSRLSRRWGVLAQGGLALVEQEVYDGPRYPIWSGALLAFWRLRATNRLTLGVEGEFNRGIYELVLDRGEFDSPADARTGASRLAVAAGDEFLFGALGIHLQLGAYVGQDLNRYVPAPVYAKLSIRTYVPLKLPMKPFVGITLKAHKATAEYISAIVGMAL